MTCQACIEKPPWGDFPESMSDIDASVIPASAARYLVAQFLLKG